MPTIDSEAQRRAIRRELAKSRQRGDFITCDGGPVLAGHSIRSAAELEADRKAKADCEWRNKCWRLYT